MNSDCYTSTPMADAPTTPTENADREMDVIQAPGEHGASDDMRVGAMELSAGKAETAGRNRISCGNINSFTIR